MTPKICTINVFLISELEKICNTRFYNTCMIYLYTKFHMPNSYGTLIISITKSRKQISCSCQFGVLYFTQRKDQLKFHIFQRSVTIFSLVWVRGGFQCYNVHVKLHQNLSSGSRVETRRQTWPTLYALFSHISCRESMTTKGR
jgi:hypothetical protein